MSDLAGAWLERFVMFDRLAEGFLIIWLFFDLNNFIIIKIVFWTYSSGCILMKYLS